MQSAYQLTFAERTPNLPSDICGVEVELTISGAHFSRLIVAIEVDALLKGAASFLTVIAFCLRDFASKLTCRGDFLCIGYDLKL